ncbi:MAG: adenylyltransferase/cytidyltransferase family protein, partial [Rhodospirillaceae bacterium]|nr:adenylyltransferase/cytidyltransferase family protein [Rhodospirillaceae bacterium]
MTLEFLDVKRGSSGPPETAREKIRGIEELARMADETRAAGGEVVLAHGVFDLLHMGHVRHLEAARAEGDLLIVTLTADRYVNKGPGRPIFPEM